jgi:hypothetical protein
MFNKLTNSRALALMMALAVLLTGVGGVMAAPPALDSETTTTTQSTDITDGGTQTYNATTASNLSWSADSANSKIIISQEGETLFTASPTPYNTVSNTSYYNVSLADDGSEYTGLEAAAGESVTLNVTLINNTEASTPDETNISFTFSNGDVESFAAVEDAQVPEEGFLSSLSLNSILGDDEDVSAARAEKTVGVVGNATETVNVYVENSNLTSALAETASAASEDDIPLVLLGTAMVDGELVPLFTESAEIPDWIDDDETYATLSDDGKMVTIHNLETSEDDSDVDVEIVGNEQANFIPTFGMLKSYGVSQYDAFTLAAVDLNLDPSWEDIEA